MFRFLVRTAVIAAVVLLHSVPARAALVGYSLLVSGNPSTFSSATTNFPVFRLTNTGATDIISFNFTIGNVSYNFDSASSASASAGSGILATLNQPDGNNNGVIRSDFIDYSFSGFNSNEFFQFQADVDSDSGNSTENFTNVFFNNGGSANSKITVAFADGTVLSRSLRETPTANATNQYAFSQGGNTTLSTGPVHGFADVVMEFYDSGAGPLAGPYGGLSPGGNPLAVDLSAVLGNEGTDGVTDWISLPTGSYVTVGFTDEVVTNGAGNDILIREIAASGEKANVYVSSDGVNFTFLGEADDGVTTAFDLASINYTSPVTAIRVVGLDTNGGSPGFDVSNIEVLSVTNAEVPEPATLTIWTLGALGCAVAAYRRRKQAS
jgi:hypothetical protein